MSNRRADVYVRWIDRHRAAILVVGGLLALLGGALAARLPLRADLANLLPPKERSVRDLDAIQARTRVLGIVLCAVAGDDPVRRAQAARALAQRLRALDPSLVAAVVSDDGVARRYAWENRFLFAPLGDLEAARDALAERIRRAKLAANPLFVPLDDADETARARAEEGERLAALRKKLGDAEEKVRRPNEIVSKDGRVQLLIVQAPFPSEAVTQGEQLVAAFTRAIDDTRREVGPGVAIGMTEDVIIAVAEHRAIRGGMSLAMLLTVLIVGASLVLYYRSAAALAALFGALAVATLVTFGFTRLSIGHLNSISAFLSAIVVGNGINFGILVLARHLEERRRGEPWPQALARALGGSFNGTVAAAVAASIAYLSLIVADFRGFRDFGVIGGVGMLLCWTAAYTLLPALLCVLERRGWVRARREPGIDALVARLLPRRPRRVAIAAGALLAIAGAISVRYLIMDPFEYDWQHLRSDRGLAGEARDWMGRIDAAFGRQFVGGFVVGAASPAQADEIERALRARAEDEPGGGGPAPLFRRVDSLHSYVPADQREKLRVLGEIRRLLDDPALETMDATDAADARRFRPPDGLRALTAPDVPDILARRFAERDGSRGGLLFANQASRFDGWNGRDMIAFADAVRAMDLPAGTAVGGGAFVFADVIRAVRRAGPRCTLVALLGVAAFVIIVVGRGRYSAVTLACLLLGTTLMLALAALIGLKINSLDFVALPITLGIGVDYAVNVVLRARAEGADAPMSALATTGGAVALCSWTTTVGYGSLLLSANAGIRSFGLMAIIGEITCLLTALTVGPALLALLRQGRGAGGDPAAAG
ncbi:MAG TPA: MMPL family transporter [Polyangia bacterium]